MLHISLRSLMPLALLALAACNPMAELKDADAAVTQFHSRFNQSDFSGIWHAADEDFRARGPRQDYDEVFTALRAKLGAETKTERDSFAVNSNNGVTTVSLENSTSFERGDGKESFVFKRDGDDLKLFSYHVESRALIVN